jgi:glutathione S-transferase
MPYVHAVMLMMLMQFFYFGILVGRARGRLGVPAPATTGDPVFERYYRVHYNTLEQLVIALPSMLLFASYVSAPVAAGLGLVFISGRFVYLRGYVADPARRGMGFGISMLPVMIMLVGALVGALRAALAG